MDSAYFSLDTKKACESVATLENLGLAVSYSYKTNHAVGDVLQENYPHLLFSIHAKAEIPLIKNKNNIVFFTQAENSSELREILNEGVTSFVVDNEVDLQSILTACDEEKKKIHLSLRMKFQEHRVGTGKYFVYGMSAQKINHIISDIKENSYIEKLGVHIHRKSQNTSEWEIVEELQDSLTKDSLKRLNMINLGGGLPAVYKSYTANVLPYIFKKLSATVDFLKEHDIETIIEPGRFIAAPAVSLHTNIIQVQNNNIIVNTTIYNCALDTHLTGTKMLVKEELSSEDDGNYFLIKGNSPTRDDIFRYRVKLKNPKIGDEITFLNAGAYNYTTDFFGYVKLPTIMK